MAYKSLKLFWNSSGVAIPSFIWVFWGWETCICQLKKLQSIDFFKNKFSFLSPIFCNRASRNELHRKFLSGPKTRCLFATQMSLLFFIREGIWRVPTYVIDVSQLLKSSFYVTHFGPSVGTVVLYFSLEREKVNCKRKWQLLFPFLIFHMKNSIVVQIHCSAEAVLFWKNCFTRNEWDYKRNILSVVLKREIYVSSLAVHPPLCFYSSTPYRMVRGKDNFCGHIWRCCSWDRLILHLK